jgi:hypothetical protein
MWYYLIVFGLCLNLLNVTLVGATEEVSNDYGTIKVDYLRGSFLKHEYLLNITFNYDAEVDIALRFKHKPNFRHSKLYRITTVPHKTYENLTENITIWGNRTEEVEVSKSRFEYKEHRGRHYIICKEWDVQKDKHYLFRLVLMVDFENQPYRPSNHQVLPGKFDVLCKKSDRSIEDSFIKKIAPYIILDPAWFDSNYGRAKKVTLSNPRVDYPVRLVIGYDSSCTYADFHLDGNCKDDLSDVVFCDTTNSTQYNHWIENVTLSKSAVFWIQSDSVNESDLYCYFNNPSAAGGTGNRGTGSDVFFSFDDFEDASQGSWTTEAGSPEYSSTDKHHNSTQCMKLEQAAIQEGARIATGSVDKNIALGYWSWVDGTVGDGFITHWHVSEDPIDQDDLIYIQGMHTTQRLRWYDGSDHPFGWIDNKTWTKYEVNDITGLTNYDVFVNYTQLVTSGNYWQSVAEYTEDTMMIADVAETSGYFVDNWYVRNWTWTEPDFSSNESDEIFVNAAPAHSGISPADGSTGLGINPTLVVYVSDTDGEWMNCTFRTNASGSWSDLQTNTTKDSWINYSGSDFSTYNTKYWWSINTTDEYGEWTNNTYDFTTQASASPSIDAHFPTNLSSGVCPGDAEIGITISDPEGDLINITFWSNLSGEWDWFYTGQDQRFTLTNLSNGTYYISVPFFNVHNHRYHWNATITDGVTVVSSGVYYSFTTTDSTSESIIITGELVTS